MLPFIWWLLVFCFFFLQRRITFSFFCRLELTCCTGECLLDMEFLEKRAGHRKGRSWKGIVLYLDYFRLSLHYSPLRSIVFLNTALSMMWTQAVKDHKSMCWSTAVHIWYCYCLYIKLHYKVNLPLHGQSMDSVGWSLYNPSNLSLSEKSILDPLMGHELASQNVREQLLHYKLPHGSLVGFSMIHS